VPEDPEESNVSLVPHAGFIIAAYAIAGAVVAAMVAWVISDYRGQRRLLADLESRGVTRRSDRRVQETP
jgi:heme exporter protein D